MKVLVSSRNEFFLLAQNDKESSKVELIKALSVYVFTFFYQSSIFNEILFAIGNLN